MRQSKKRVFSVFRSARQNVRGGRNEKPQSLPLPRPAREGEAAFSKKMTEGICFKFQSAPSYAAFESPQALRASVPTLFGPSGHFPLIGGIGPLSPRGAFPAPEVRVGTDDSVRPQDAPILQKPSANPYAPSHLSVGVDAHIDPAECAGFTVIAGEFVTAQRADRVVAPTGNRLYPAPASSVRVCGKHLLCTPASICGIII